MLTLIIDSNVMNMPEVMDCPPRYQNTVNGTSLEELEAAFCLCGINSSPNFVEPLPVVQNGYQSYELLTNNKKLNINEDYIEKKVSLRYEFCYLLYSQIDLD